MRRRIRTKIRTYAPRDFTVIIAGLLWLIGALDILGGAYLPSNLGTELLGAAGLLLILASLIRDL